MLLPFFEWMESLAVYGPSIYLGPAVNIVHLTAMVTFLGALLIVDLRLLGTGLTQQPTASVARDAQPWLLAGLVVLIVTGVPAVMATTTLPVRQFGVLGEDVSAGHRADLHLHRAAEGRVCRRRPVRDGDDEGREAARS